MFSNYITCIIIEWFLFYVDNIIRNIKDVYTNCRLFILSRNVKCLHYPYPILLTTFESFILIKLDLDNCDKKQYCFFFCII